MWPHWWDTIRGEKKVSWNDWCPLLWVVIQMVLLVHFECSISMTFGPWKPNISVRLSNNILIFCVCESYASIKHATLSYMWWQQRREPLGSMWRLFELLFMAVEWEERSRHSRVAGVWIICWNINPHSAAVRRCVIHLAHLLTWDLKM